MQPSSTPASAGLQIRTLTGDPTGRWLASAWSDLRRSPGIGLVYGAACAAASWLVTVLVIVNDAWYLLLPLLGGFMFLAPLGAVGLYEVSRRHEMGLPATWFDALTAVGRNGQQIALMGLLLMLFLLAWSRLALLLFALFFGLNPPPLEAFASTLLKLESLPFLLISNAIGGVLAVLAFGISAFSLPMLMDREVDVVTAVITSLRACRRNWRSMVGWAGLVVLIAGLGLLPLYLGLTVAMPLLGHATWHAYRDMIAWPEPS